MEPHSEPVSMTTVPDTTVTTSTDMLPDVVTESFCPSSQLLNIEPGRPADPDVVQKLSGGVLAHLLPELQRAKNTLCDLTRSQQVLIETVVQENNKFHTCSEASLLTERMVKAKLYHSKLVNIKKDMTFLRDKATRLKRQALKLQQQKQKEALQLEQQRERELEKERSLVAKVATKPMKSNQSKSKGDSVSSSTKPKVAAQSTTPVDTSPKHSPEDTTT